MIRWRATKPTDVPEGELAVGPVNASFIEGAARRASIFIAAWGGVKGAAPYGRRMVEIARVCGAQVMCLGTTAGGEPRHPLMLPYDTPLVPWEAPDAA